MWSSPVFPAVTAFLFDLDVWVDVGRNDGGTEKPSRQSVTQAGGREVNLPPAPPSRSAGPLAAPWLNPKSEPSHFFLSILQNNRSYRFHQNHRRLLEMFGWDG